MGVFKILACAVVGVGAVAAAPFTGGGSVLAGATLLGSLAGAGTIAAAAGAAAVGATVGGALSEMDKEQQRTHASNAWEEGFEAGKALTTVEYKKLFTEFQNKLSRYHNFERQVVGLYAVGIAAAYADKDFSEEERRDLEEFVSGAASKVLPQHIKGTLEELRNRPPSLEEAIEKAKHYGCCAEDITDVILLIINADGVVLPEEVQFMERWEALKPSYSTVQ